MCNDDVKNEGIKKIEDIFLIFSDQIGDGGKKCGREAATDSIGKVSW